MTDFDGAIDFDAAVDFDYSGGSIEAAERYPTVTIEMAFGFAPFDPSPTWVDVSDYVTGRLTTSAGRGGELDKVTPGTCSFALTDRARVFDPLNAAGAYYGQLVPWVPLRVTATFAGTSHRLFYGYVQSWPQSCDISNRFTRVDIIAFDLLSILARRGFVPRNPFTVEDPVYGVLDGIGLLSGGEAPTLEMQSSGARIEMLALACGIPSAMLDISAGSSPLQAGEVKEQTILEHFAKVEGTELGRIWCTPAGVLRFAARRELEAITTSATFSDSPSAAYRYAMLALDPADVRLLRNRVTRGSESVGEYTASDALSIATHDLADDTDTSLLFASALDALSQAQYIVGRYATATPRITSLVIMPQRDGGTALFPKVLGLHLGDLIDVVRTPLGTGSTYAQFATIERVTHEVDISARAWSTTWELSEPDTNYYFTVEDSIRGRINSVAVVAY